MLMLKFFLLISTIFIDLAIAFPIKNDEIEGRRRGGGNGGLGNKRRPCRGRSNNEHPEEGRTFFHKDWQFLFADVNYNYNYNIICGGAGPGAGTGIANKPRPPKPNFGNLLQGISGITNSFSQSQSQTASISGDNGGGSFSLPQIEWPNLSFPNLGEIFGSFGSLFSNGGGGTSSSVSSSSSSVSGGSPPAVIPVTETPDPDDVIYNDEGSNNAVSGAVAGTVGNTKPAIYNNRNDKGPLGYYNSNGVYVNRGNRYYERNIERSFRPAAGGRNSNDNFLGSRNFRFPSS